MWATHAVHHSATKLNFTAAIRLGWTGNISGNFLFFLPLIFIGFHPFAVIGMLGVNLFYQFFIHTELVSRLGSTGMDSQHARPSPRASRVESGLPRQELRRHPDRVRPDIRNLRRGASGSSAALRTCPRHQQLQPGQDCAWRMAQHDQRFRPRTDAARAGQDAAWAAGLIGVMPK
jgi:Fatty acid hydroxylase superfamily